MDTPKLTKNEELNLKGVAAELHATILRRHLYQRSILLHFWSLIDCSSRCDMAVKFP